MILDVQMVIQRNSRVLYCRHQSADEGNIIRGGGVSNLHTQPSNIMQSTLRIIQQLLFIGEIGLIRDLLSEILRIEVLIQVLFTNYLDNLCLCRLMSCLSNQNRTSWNLHTADINSTPVTQTSNCHF